MYRVAQKSRNVEIRVKKFQRSQLFFWLIFLLQIFRDDPSLVWDNFHQVLYRLDEVEKSAFSAILSKSCIASDREHGQMNLYNKFELDISKNGRDTLRFLLHSGVHLSSYQAWYSE